MRYAIYISVESVLTVTFLNLMDADYFKVKILFLVILKKES